MPLPNRHPNAAKPWTSEEVEVLRSLAEAGTPLREIASQLGRSQEAVRTRAAKYSIALGKNRIALKVERETARREGAEAGD
jgi:DNA-binding NarL/FixJ family response regulator